MGAFPYASVPVLGTDVPLTPVTALLGLAGLTLAGWLVVVGRFFSRLDRSRSSAATRARASSADRPEADAAPPAGPGGAGG